jgi:hypothetical protein
LAFVSLFFFLSYKGLDSGELLKKKLKFDEKNKEKSLSPQKIFQEKNKQNVL